MKHGPELTSVGFQNLDFRAISNPAGGGTAKGPAGLKLGSLVFSSRSVSSVVGLPMPEGTAQPDFPAPVCTRLSKARNDRNIKSYFAATMLCPNTWVNVSLAPCPFYSHVPLRGFANSLQTSSCTRGLASSLPPALLPAQS